MTPPSGRQPRDRKPGEGKSRGRLPAGGGKPSSRRGTTSGRSVQPTGSRPATSRSTAGPVQQRRRPNTQPALAGSAKQGIPTARSRGRLTGRAAVLGLAVCAVVLTLAYPMREYLAQRSQIAQLTQQEQSQRSRVAALEEQRRRWEDPAYIKAQARQRLQYVMPGEVGYVVVNPDQVRTGTGGKATMVAPSGAGKNAPWYSRLWGTVPAADVAK